MTASKRYRLFDAKYENLMLGAPIVVAVFVLLELILRPEWTNFGRNTLTMLIAIPLLDSSHPILTYLMLRKLPEGRQWSKQYALPGPLNVFWVTLILFVCSTVFFAYTYANDTQSGRTLTIIATMAFMFFSYHHILLQSHGISCLYSSELMRNENLSLEQNQEILSRQKKERYLIYALIGLRWLTHLQLILSLENLKVLRQLMFFPMMVLVVLILRNAYLSPHIEKSNRFRYLLRLLIYPFSSVSGVAAVVGPLLHGTEYLLVYKKITGASLKLKPAQYFWLWTLMMILAISALKFFFFLQKGRFISDTNLQFAAVIIGALITSMGMTHYWLDRQIFQFRRPVSRQLWGGLLADVRISDVKKIS